MIPCSARVWLTLPFPILLVAVGGLLGGLTTPAPASGQSLLGAGGLGLLSEPLDARARSLGVGGVGLSRWHMSLVDPAAQAGLILPSAAATFQPTVTRFEGTAEAGGTRFPTFGASYPFGRHVLSVQFGSFLEQEWTARVERTLELRGEEVEAVDRYESEGGIGQVRLGWATRLNERFAVGVSVGSYVGALERRFIRSLDPAAVGSDVETFQTAGRWRASGPLVAAGVIWDPSTLLRVSGSLEWSGDITLDPVGPTAGEERSYPMPLTVRGGGTFTLTPGLALVAGLSRADWSDADEALGGGAARDVAWSVGGGLEWMAANVRGRQLPLRLGVHRQDLPFHFNGEPVRESGLATGFGLHLAEAEQATLARIEFGLERGSRDAGVFSESYWRTTLSVRLAGG